MLLLSDSLANALLGMYVIVNQSDSPLSVFQTILCHVTNRGYFVRREVSTHI